MRLTLLRHGQTPSNVAGALDTAPPGPGLTELGRRQADAVPTALAADGIDAVFASDQLRAQQTATPLAQHRRLSIATLSDLREIFAGELEMRADLDSVRRYIGTLISWLEGDLARRMPGGPDGAEFLARYDAAIDSIVAHVGPSGSAVAVSHGAAIRVWAATRAVNAESALLAPEGEPAAHIVATGHRHRHLDNTGAVTLERRATGEWAILNWHAEAIGGAALDTPSTSGPTS